MQAGTPCVGSIAGMMGRLCKCSVTKRLGRSTICSVYNEVFSYLCSVAGS